MSLPSEYPALKQVAPKLRIASTIPKISIWHHPPLTMYQRVTHALCEEGQTAYRYWQRPVPSGTGFILADLSYVVKLSEGMMRSSKEAHRIQQFCGDASSAAVWNSIAPV